MSLHMVYNWMRHGRIAHVLLVLLLTVRVASAAAVECQHDLATAERTLADTKAQVLAEVLALGGELCLVDGTDSAAPNHDEPHLFTPCPFFKSPAALTDISTPTLSQSLRFYHADFTYRDLHIEVAKLPAAFSPRAPPVQG